MNDDAKNLARNLKILMDHHQDTQRTLANRSGTSQKTISNMLNPGDDRAPHLQNIAAVANAYHLQAWHLLIHNPAPEILLNSSLEKIVENYARSDKHNRETLLRISEDGARYSELTSLFEQKANDG